MRWATLILVGVLAGCGSPEEPKTTPEGGATTWAEAQKIVDTVAARHKNLRRLTLHAVPAEPSACTQIASTMAARRGKPSDPEDLEAMRTGKEVVLDEPGAIDVTVPIRVKDGKPTAIAGVTLASPAGADREALLGEARAVARELDQEIQAAGKPLW